PLPPRSPLFPYTTLFRSSPAPSEQFYPKGTLVCVTWLDAAFDLNEEQPLYSLRTYGEVIRHNSELICLASEGDGTYYRAFTTIPDRKSTRLNSSHVKISY